MYVFSFNYIRLILTIALAFKLCVYIILGHVKTDLNSQIIIMFILIRVRIMVFNTIFSNISVILWQSVLLLDTNNEIEISEFLLKKACMSDFYTIKQILGRSF